MSKLYFNDDTSASVQLDSIFSSNSWNSTNKTNSTYANNNTSNAFPNTVSFDLKPSGSLLNSTQNCGYQLSTSDLVTIFNPIYADIASTQTITIPSWCNRIGFVIIAGGGYGGTGYTDNWTTYSTITNYAQGVSTYEKASYDTTTYDKQVHYYDYYNWGNAKTDKNECYSQNSTTTTTYYSAASTYGAYISSYTKGSQANAASYGGSGGGGGASVAGIYNNRSSKSTTFTVSITNNTTTTVGSYYIQFNNETSGTTSSITANNGTNSTTGSAGGQDTTDTHGTGGGVSVNSKATTTLASSVGYFDALYYSSGSNGTVGSTSSGTGTGGGSGYGGTISSGFLPSISGSNIGKGGDGVTTTTQTAGTSGAIRIWYLR